MQFVFYPLPCESKIMLRDNINNINVTSEQVLVTPETLKSELPVTDHALSVIQSSRQIISDIIHHDAGVGESSNGGPESFLRESGDTGSRHAASDRPDSGVHAETSLALWMIN